MERILKLLKPKVVSLGFNEKELESAVKGILKLNPDLEKEDTTDEAINAILDAVIPILGVGQQNSTRVINEFKKNQKNNPNPPEDEPKDEDKGSENQNTNKNNDKLEKKLDLIMGELASLKGEKTRDTRKIQLEQVVKDAGKYGQKILKEFEERTYKTFDNDEEFEAYLESTKTDVLDYLQEEKDKGLSNFSSIGGSNKPVSKGEPDKEIVEEIVNNLL